MPPSLLDDPLAQRFRYLRGAWVLPEAELADIHGITPERLLRRLRPFEPLPGELCTFFEKGDLLPLGVAPRADGSAPLAFSEAGALAAGCMLGTRGALGRSVAVVRAFARLRQSGWVPTPMPIVVQMVVQEPAAALPGDTRRRQMQPHDQATFRRLTPAPAPAIAAPESVATT